MTFLCTAYSIYPYASVTKMSSVVTAKVKKAVESSYWSNVPCWHRKHMTCGQTVKNLWAKVLTTGSRSPLIGACYKPHEHDPDSFKKFARSFDLASKINCHTWVLGDFNLLKLDWTTLSPGDGCNYSTFYRECIDTFNDHCLEQMISL